MNKILTLATVLAASPAVYAAQFDVTVENLTRGVYFTPLLVAAHSEDVSIFELGQSASTELQTMAEGGDISLLVDALDAAGATQSNNPAAGLLAPGAQATVTLNTDNQSANTRLSVAAMLLPTNDGFVAANGLAIPSEPGSYVYYLNGYDAGTEANDEIRGSGAVGEAGFPVPPPLDPMVGTGGSGITNEAEGYVHVHRGVLGDTDAAGGNSDIDSTLHRWLNPVAKLTIVIQ